MVDVVVDLTHGGGGDLGQCHLDLPEGREKDLKCFPNGKSVKFVFAESFTFAMEEV